MAIHGGALRAPDGPAAVYVHVPFCLSRCAYCAFVTTEGREALLPGYLEGVADEASGLARALGGPVPARTVYLGGGTPSRVPGRLLKRLAGRLRSALDLPEGAEWTAEANPGDVTEAWLADARAAGVSRLSLGMQAADDRTLRLLGRRHRHRDTVRAVRAAQRQRVPSLSLDLIFGLPGQTAAGWRATVEAALALEPDHISVYALGLEAGTPLAGWVERGLVEAPDGDRAADMYEWAAGRLRTAGYGHYEISNWARGAPGPDGFPEHACRHNLAYWLQQPYIGLGAAAHGDHSGIRTRNTASLKGYLGRLRRGPTGVGFPRSPATVWWRRVDEDERAADTLLLGMRLVTRGVEAAAYRSRHGAAAWSRAEPAFERLMDQGLIEALPGGRGVRLSARGLLLGNRVFAEFI